MAEAKDLVISEWQKGIADSPMLGFGMMKNVDTHSQSGAVKVSHTITVHPNTVNGLITSIAYDPKFDHYWGYSSTGYLYSAAGGNPTQVQQFLGLGDRGQGLAYFKGWLVVISNNKVHFQGDGTNTIGVYQDVLTLAEGNDNHPSIWAEDDTLYIGDGRYVATLKENTGTTFTPATPSTYTWNNQALNLPQYYQITSLVEMGSRLFVGTKFSFSQRRADIFSWDRTSSSFFLPVRINERGVRQMIVHNNLIYAVCGDQPSVYKTDGTQAVFVREFRESFTQKTYNTRASVYRDAITIDKNRIMIGASFTDAALTYPTSGIYALDITTGALNLETAFRLTGDPILIGAVRYDDSSYPFLTYQLGSTYKVGNLQIRSGDYTNCYVDSPLIAVADGLVKRKFTQAHIHLSKPLTANQGVRLKWRKSSTETFTTIATFTETGKTSMHTPFTGETIDQIQIRVEFYENNGSQSSPELRTVRLR